MPRPAKPVSKPVAARRTVQDLLSEFRTYLDEPGKAARESADDGAQLEARNSAYEDLACTTLIAAIDTQQGA